MKYIFFILNTALEDLKRNKLRTFLTSLGILIGISSVVLLSAFGLGLRRYIEDQFKSIGSNLVMLMPGKGMAGGFSSAGGMMSGAKFDDKDIINLRKIKDITVVAPMYVKFTNVSSEGNTELYEVIASNEDVFKALNMEEEYGSLYTKTDADKGAKIVVMGSKPAEKIFGDMSLALGKIIKIDDQAFKVKGVLKSKGGGGLGAPSIDDHVFIPFKSAYSFNPSKKYYAVYIKTANEEAVSTVKKEVRDMLLKRYNADDFSVSDQKEVIDTLSVIFNMVNMVVLSISTISLIVGGVGVMNIMYVAVIEKTREIGIRRAIGARKLDILLLFLSESIFLSLTGGLLGLSISYILVLLSQRFFPAYIDLRAVLTAVLVSTSIGLIFGVFPAKKAADLSPIDAIRYE